MIAWLRLLADPTDAAAAVRALSRPPVELRSVDLARCTTIARRSKLDMVSALEASLESPQIPPEARDRIRGFLSLYGAAARAMGELPADVFVRRLIERVGFRRQRLFAAHPEAAERLRNLSRLGELAADWTRREPGGLQPRLRPLPGRRLRGRRLARGGARLSPPSADGRGPGDAARRAQGDSSSTASTSSGCRPRRCRARSRPARPTCPMSSAAAGASHETASARLLYIAMTRARASALVLTRPRADGRGRRSRPSPFYEEARAVLGADEQSTARSCSAPPRACTRPTG